MTPKVKAKRSMKKPRGNVKVPAQRAGRTSTSRLSSKNQLTVPVDILRKVGLEAGDEVEFTVNGAGCIEISKTVHNEKLFELIGKYTDLYRGFDIAKERESSWPA